jgi:hypothetical protein
VHAPDCSASIDISDPAPQGRRAVADAGRWATEKGFPMRFALVILLCLSAVGQAAEIPIGTTWFSLGSAQPKVMEQVNASFVVVPVSGQPSTFFLYENGKPNGRLLGGIAFTEGRLTWAQRNWGSFGAGTKSDEPAKALFSALESAIQATNSSAVVTVETQRVPGIEFKTTNFRFKGRTVTMIVSDGDAEHGGKQVSIDESIKE